MKCLVCGEGDVLFVTATMTFFAQSCSEDANGNINTGRPTAYPFRHELACSFTQCSNPKCMVQRVSLEKEQRFRSSERARLLMVAKLEER